MPFLSDLIGKIVADVNGVRVGRLEDLVASTSTASARPSVVALVVRRSNSQMLVPYKSVAVPFGPGVSLNQESEALTDYHPHEQDLYLVRDVLDKQIIDTNGMRVVRVNDLELARSNGFLHVTNVDVSGLGLMRRLGFATIVTRLAKRLHYKIAPNMIGWDDVELLPGDQPIRLKAPGEKVTDLHPADLAEIISDLSPTQSTKLLEVLEAKTVADALEEVEPDFQVSLIGAMTDEKAADVLEEMAPDEAADLLGELSDARSQELLNLMEHKEADEVRKLLAYDENSAGGIMTTEFVAVRAGLTAEEAIEHLRATAHEAETIFYVYVTDEKEHLAGVFSLQDLVLALPTTPISEFMHERIFSVQLDASQEEVAQAISKYNLLAVPVLDGEGCLHGIVTADDALDKIIPTAWKKRLPRMYR